MIAIHFNFKANGLSVRRVHENSGKLGALLAVVPAVTVENAVFTVDAVKLAAWRSGAKPTVRQFAEVRAAHVDTANTPAQETLQTQDGWQEVFFNPRISEAFLTADQRKVTGAAAAVICGRRILARGLSFA